jgi:hypothetical protein
VQRRGWLAFVHPHRTRAGHNDNSPARSLLVDAIISGRRSARRSTRGSTSMGPLRFIRRRGAFFTRGILKLGRRLHVTKLCRVAWCPLASPALSWVRQHSQNQDSARHAL